MGQISAAVHSLASLLGVSLALAVPGSSVHIENPTGRRIAVLVGVSEYRSPDMSLQTPHLDAARMGEKLRSLGWETTVLASEPGSDGADASKAEILAALGGIKCQPEDTLLFYFSGHGLHDSGVDYLAPSDLSKISETWDLNSMISIKDLGFALAGTSAKRRILILDAGRTVLEGKNAGAGLPPAWLESSPSEDEADRVSWAAFYSCSPGENAWESERSGVYTNVLLNALDAASSDSKSGEVSLSLVDSISRAAMVEITHTGNRQMPQFFCHVAGLALSFRSAATVPVPSPEIPAPPAVGADGASFLLNYRAEPDSESLPAKIGAVSPDGSTLASGILEDTIRLWHARTGELKRELEGHTDPVYSVAFSPDGSTLASGGMDETIRLWDAQSGELKRELKGHAGWVYSVAFSTDGLTLASGSLDGTIRLWDTQTGRLNRKLEGLGSVYSVAFSPDGSTLASGGDDETIRLWDARTGELKRELKGHAEYILSVAFSPDGSILASGLDDATIHLGDVRTGKLKRELKGHTDTIFSVAFSPDGSTLAGRSRDNTIRLWDSKTGEVILQLEGGLSVIFGPDGSLYSGDRRWTFPRRVTML